MARRLGLCLVIAALLFAVATMATARWGNRGLWPPAPGVPTTEVFIVRHGYHAGIIIPGAVLIMALVWLFPESRALFSKEGVTLGELGLFVIIAYAAGQLVQAIGNYLEWIWWKPSIQTLVAKRIAPMPNASRLSCHKDATRHVAAAMGMVP